jgi:RNA-directed DNA polymerase
MLSYTKVGRLPLWSFVTRELVELLKGEKQMNMKMCASSDIIRKWEGINFKTAYNYVKKLQMRIVKAQKQKKFNKVKSLQRLLVTSFYAKALAIKRTTENTGKNTAGVDGELWLTTPAKFKAISRLKRRGYNPKPLRRIYIPKKNNKKRPLSIPSMIDRAMQMLYKFALEPIAETIADKNSYGFRKERCPQDAIEQCFKILSKGNAARWILEADIKSCFDNINHDWILNNTPMDKYILGKWLKCGYIETKKLFPTEEGAPQGSPISPTICNIVLDGLEEAILKNYHKITIKGKAYFPKVNFVRFADDFIVTGISKEILEYGILPIIAEFLAERGLKLSKEKTLITQIEDGFNFLGCNIRKYNGKLLIKPSKANIKAFLTKIRNQIKTNKSLKQEILIKNLNPIIRGWTNYHKHNVSSKAFEYVDYQIFKCLWSWCLRRHKNKGKKWVKSKYFNTVGNRTWTFSVPTKKKMDNGEIVYIRLIYATATNIVRFKKIKAKANPFSSEDMSYFKERKDYKMRNNLKGRYILEKLYKSQKGICPVCNKKITIETDFRIQDEVTHKWMLHPYCKKTISSNVNIFELIP